MSNSGYMPKQAPIANRILLREDFDQLLTQLQVEGRTVLGPCEKDGAITYDEIGTASDLPIGRTDRQSEGTYRLRERKDAALFGYAVGPDSWKRYLHPPQRRLWRATREAGTVTVEEISAPLLRAFLGVRACELAAIKRLDKIFLEGDYINGAYAMARRNALIIAVNCGSPSETCFCSSMETGPKVDKGYDLALTELIDEKGHRFLLEAGTQVGQKLIAEINTRPANDDDMAAAHHVTKTARAQMGRTLRTEGLKEGLAQNADHAHWAEIAERCLACGNCTQVCPTCFCTSIEDHTNLQGDQAERVQVWDSCFTSQFSELSGGQVREMTASRYRQWMTHKLSSWFDQFDTSGCVGCGRCITWCPVGIDITKEAEIIAGAGQALT